MAKLPIKGTAQKKLEEAIERLKKEGIYDKKKNSKKSPGDQKRSGGDKERSLKKGRVDERPDRTERPGKG